MIEFYVQDFGPGIAYEHLPASSSASIASIRRARENRAEPAWGWRSPSTSSRPMAGTIRWRANLGSATTFLFRLPLAARPARCASNWQVQ